MVSETVPSAAPRAEYSRRVEELSVERSHLQRRERLVGYVQLGLGACCVAWILFRLSHFSRTDLLVLIPIALFVVIAALHGRLLRVVSLRTRAIAFYEQGSGPAQWYLGGKRSHRRALPATIRPLRTRPRSLRAGLALRVAVHGTHPCRGRSAGSMADRACAARRGPRPAKSGDRAKPSPDVSGEPV